MQNSKVEQQSFRQIINSLLPGPTERDLVPWQIVCLTNTEKEEGC